MPRMPSTTGPRELGELFAAPAAIAVQNAQVLEQTKRLAATLQAVLTNQGDHRPGAGNHSQP